ncbi:MAG: nucleoside 2-deoxyribosyltransferase [Candidatus Bathyarchaeota archaeon]
MIRPGSDANPKTVSPNRLDVKIYFAGSIRGEKPDPGWFKTLITLISRHGKVLTEHSFDYSPEDEARLDDQQIYERDMAWLREADAVVAEVTAPSLGVGYEVAQAEEWGKPILLLYRETPGRKPSAMLNGNRNLRLFKYVEEKGAIRAVDEFLEALMVSYK